MEKIKTRKSKGKTGTKRAQEGPRGPKMKRKRKSRIKRNKGKEKGKKDQRGPQEGLK